jgi:hypothetical protein
MRGSFTQTQPSQTDANQLGNRPVSWGASDLGGWGKPPVSMSLGAIAHPRLSKIAHSDHSLHAARGPAGVIGRSNSAAVRRNISVRTPAGLPSSAEIVSASQRWNSGASGVSASQASAYARRARSFMRASGVPAAGAGRGICGPCDRYGRIGGRPGPRLRAGVGGARGTDRPHMLRRCAGAPVRAAEARGAPTSWGLGRGGRKSGPLALWGRAPSVCALTIKGPIPKFHKLSKLPGAKRVASLWPRPGDGAPFGDRGRALSRGKSNHGSNEICKATHGEAALTINGTRAPYRNLIRGIENYRR